MIGAFEFGNFRIVGKANTLSQQLNQIVASRGQFNQWQEEQANKAHSQAFQITSRRSGPQNCSANSEEVL